MEDRQNAKKFLQEEREKRTQECGKKLAELLKEFDCSLASYQELVNGMPKGPASIVLVAND